jgi:hypothetical protein
MKRLLLLLSLFASLGAWAQRNPETGVTADEIMSGKCVSPNPDGYYGTGTRPGTDKQAECFKARYEEISKLTSSLK